MSHTVSVSTQILHQVSGEIPGNRLSLQCWTQLEWVLIVRKMHIFLVWLDSAKSTIIYVLLYVNKCVYVVIGMYLIWCPEAISITW